MGELPPIREYMTPTLAAIADADGECSNDEIRAAVAKRLGLSEEQVTLRHATQGTRTELEYRLAWARTKLRKKGLVQATGPRRWKLTNEGWSEVGRHFPDRNVGPR